MKYGVASVLLIAVCVAGASTCWGQVAPAPDLPEDVLIEEDVIEMGEPIEGELLEPMEFEMGEPDAMMDEMEIIGEEPMDLGEETMEDFPEIMEDTEAPMQDVQSSLIQEVGYDPEAQVLTVHFVGTDEVYEYTGVPADVYDELMAAESKGSYFVNTIKGNYDYTKK